MLKRMISIVAVLIAGMTPASAMAMQTSVKDLIKDGLVSDRQTGAFTNPQCESESLAVKRATALGYGGGYVENTYPDLRYAWDSNFG